MLRLYYLTPDTVKLKLIITEKNNRHNVFYKFDNVVVKVEEVKNYIVCVQTLCRLFGLNFGIWIPENVGLLSYEEYMFFGELDKVDKVGDKESKGL